MALFLFLRGYATRARLTTKQKRALEHSRVLAASLAHGTRPDAEQPPLDEEPTDALEPSPLPLDVLATYRPTRPPPLTASVDRYAKEYARAYARLDKAFVRDQLWNLWRLSHAEGTPGARKPGKRQIVQSLLEQWGWPRVEQVERERQVVQWKKMIVEKDIPMTHAEAYLLLRRDPAFTSLLVAEHRVALNMVVPTAGSDSSDRGLWFRVKGKNAIVQEIEGTIDAGRRRIHVERFPAVRTPGARFTELYQPISDLSGAFLEPQGEGLVVSYLDEGARDRALRLLRAAEERLERDPRAARVLAAGDEGTRYALYPYTTVPVPLPPTAGDAAVGATTNDWVVGGKNLFRVRRLGGWFGRPEAEGDVARLLARDVKSRESRKSALLRDWLKESTTLDEAHWNTHQYERHVAVQPGHLVYCTADAQPVRLAPPPELQGDHSLGGVCRRLMGSEMRAVFIPLSAVPFEADVSAFPPRRVRRVRYRTTETQVEGGWTCTIDVEVELPSVEASAEGVVDSGEPARVAARQTHRRSWHVMCPDSDRDLSIQEKVSRTLDVASEVPQLTSIVQTLQADPELGVVPLQLELGTLGSYALATDDTVSSSLAQKDAVSSLIETVESSRTFSSAGTTFKTMAAFENLNSALRANRSTV